MNLDLKLVWARLRGLAARDPKSLAQAGLKLSEETGELLRELLIRDGALPREAGDVPGELADVLICTLALAEKLGYSDQDLADAMKRKADKYEAAIVMTSVVQTRRAVCL